MDELEAWPGAGPDGLLDIQDDIGVAEIERELPELIDQDSDTSESQVQLSGSAVVLQRHHFPFESLSIKGERLPRAD